MKRIRRILHRSFALVAALMLISMAPAPVFAEETTPTTTTSTQTPTPTTTSPQTPTSDQPLVPPDNGPTGPDAHLYHYNFTSQLWENDYYTYDPTTKATAPKVPLEYTCNPVTSKWDTTIWRYSTAQDAYAQVPVSLDVAPAGAVTHPCPLPPQTAAQNTAPSATSDVAQPNANPTPTQPDTTTNSTQNNATGVTMNTDVGSNATSGSALVAHNDDVNGVGTGNATVSANVINMLQSQAAFAGPGVATFTANIQGNVQGDLVIDPTTLAQPASTTQNSLNNATITNATNGTINNNIVLNAASGNATVNDNNDVGTVTTGNATAIADVINMINSIVAANQSFVGTINIYGNYTGNILMPIDSLNALLASAGTNSATNNASSSVDNTGNYAIANNVNLGTTSGSATVTDNNKVGSVTTGNAMTNLTILNLTGKQVIAANSLLVFVNVLGNWVGLIMDAPAGTTAAMLGGGVNNNATLANNAQVTNTENYGINNNITANATSGSANVTNNNDVGSVATGNALASVNLANLINSNFSVSNWFGVLFINVFGSWHGNFGVMKPPVVAPITSGSALPGQAGQPGQGGGGVSEILKDAKVFAFVPTDGASLSSTGGMKLSPVTVTNTDSNQGGSSSSGNLLAKATAVLGARQSVKPHLPLSKAVSGSFSYWTVGLLGLGSAGLLYVAVERVRSGLRSRYVTKY